MDFANLEQAFDEMRRDVAAGDTEKAATRYREAFGADADQAQAAIAEIAAGKPLVFQQSHSIVIDRNGRRTEVTGDGPMPDVGEMMKSFGLDPGKLGMTEITARENRFLSSRATLQASGGVGGSLLKLMNLRPVFNAAQPTAQPKAEAPAPAASVPQRHVSTIERPRTHAVERSRGPGLGGVLAALLVAAATAAAAFLFVHH